MKVIVGNQFNGAHESELPVKNINLEEWTLTMRRQNSMFIPGFLTLIGSFNKIIISFQ